MELLRRYSNRSDLLGPVQAVLGRIVSWDQTDEPVIVTTGHGGAGVRRLGADGEAELISLFQSELTLQQLATGYGVGKSTVQPVLRHRGVRRRP